MSADSESPKPLTRPKTLGLAAAFIALSIAIKLGAWIGGEVLFTGVLLRSMLAGLLALAAALSATQLLCRKWPGSTQPELILLPRLTWSALGRSATAVMAGVGLFALVFGLALMTGALSVRFKGLEWHVMLALAVLILVATVLNAAWEEYTFRGWPFSACVLGFGPHGVALTLGLGFGLAHMLNPQWTVAAIVSVAFAGLLICYTMLAFKNILVPIGLHVGWNTAQSILTSGRFWEKTLHPNPLLSGGKYGLEGSLVGIVVTALAAGCAFALFVSRRRKDRLKETSRASHPTPG